MKRKSWQGLLTVTVGVLGAASAFVAAAQTAPAPKVDLAKGRQVAETVCAACHGADGNSLAPVNPKLAQQHAEYLVKQLNNFVVQPGQKKAARENAIMAGFAAQLSPEDRKNVAYFYASQTIKPGVATDKATLEIGQRIWRAGVPEKGLPACSGCHSPDGSGIPSQYPRLGGQYAEYSAAQLKAFRDGTRANNVPMQQIAAKMSDAEIRAVTDYIQGLRR
ncbi:MAG TPA: c-type cytochrome [Burkholderiaceae bacterium]|jgi:cytochrome c553|nr:c-type cytochrome [Burkholderiaceae bacterium]HPE01293.1 c-type cytochrome [Burkholderiaceae bacterium]HRZ00130.1 c-type cytochrome [Burkholderiaceae bacterium]